MPTAQNTINEDILEVVRDLAQMTSDGFAQTNARLDEHGKILNEHTRILDEHSRILREHSQEIRDVRKEVSVVMAIALDLSAKHSAYISDISDILDRIVTLEKRTKLNKSEILELRRLLQAVINWARNAAKTLNIPLRVPS